ncbi:helix-turn-helix transcriptional regulator [Candidatus Dojkabacteria bacterium]|nr:helix-turn-helix transcriptional regulator [Candidatus Dojkabacteria bacterium]
MNKDNTIGIQIKKARTENGLSQEELGEKIGVTWEMISRYENGRSSPSRHLDKLAKVLGKSVAYLYGQDTDPIKYNVEKIASALREQGIGYERKANEVVLVDDIAILGFERSLKLTRQYYNAPEWLLEKYGDVFALRLNSILPDELDTNEGDIGFFSTSLKPTTGDIVLAYSGKKYSLKKFSLKLKGEVLAVLLVQEKRFR